MEAFTESSMWDAEQLCTYHVNIGVGSMHFSVLCAETEIMGLHRGKAPLIGLWKLEKSKHGKVERCLVAASVPFTDVDTFATCYKSLSKSHSWEGRGLKFASSCHFCSGTQETGWHMTLCRRVALWCIAFGGPVSTNKKRLRISFQLLVCSWKSWSEEWFQLYLRRSVVNE